MNFSRADLQLALEGDKAYLATFVEESAPVIQSRVARALRRRSYQAAGRQIRQEIEDLSQEVFLSLFANNAKALHSWNPEKGLSLKSFVSLVADRQIASLLRTGKTNPWTEDPTLGPELEYHAETRGDLNLSVVGTGSSQHIEPEKQVASAELLRNVVERLREQLSPQGFRLFQLFCVEGRDVKEICVEMNMTAAAVYKWRERLIQLARKIQQEILSENGAISRKQTMGGIH